jgi:nicotinate-nucleotide adenylyltransferase
VWWLVSPQNPLKPVAGMAPFTVRLAAARRLTEGHPKIRVSDFETRLGSAYTADTLVALRRHYPRHRFVWLMGGDNLVQIRRWERWTDIFATVPIAVFARPSYSLRALAALPAQRFARYRLPPRAARRLAETKPPAWVFFPTRLDARSATQIRAERRRMLSATFKPERSLVIAIPVPLQPKPYPAAGNPQAARPSLLELVLQTLDDGKAEDVVTIDLAGKTVIADHLVIATGRSSRQVVALTEHLDAALSGRTAISIEGKAQGDWVLIDAGDVIVHLFRPEVRAYYNLEKMWGGALPEPEAARQ